jgi:hypothetical protein
MPWGAITSLRPPRSGELRKKICPLTRPGIKAPRRRRRRISRPASRAAPGRGRKVAALRWRHGTRLRCLR